MKEQEKGSHHKRVIPSTYRTDSLDEKYNQIIDPECRKLARELVVQVQKRDYMVIKCLDQSRHSLEKIFENQKASPSVRELLITLHVKLTQELEQKNLEWLARTHMRGITYKCNERKAFMIVDVRQRFLAYGFFTGNSRIDGLEKGNWMQGEDNMGTKVYRITDSASLERAVLFAMKAYEITQNWVKRV